MVQREEKSERVRVGEREGEKGDRVRGRGREEKGARQSGRERGRRKA